MKDEMCNNSCFSFFLIFAGTSKNSYIHIPVYSETVLWYTQQYVRSNICISVIHIQVVRAKFYFLFWQSVIVFLVLDKIEMGGFFCHFY